MGKLCFFSDSIMNHWTSITCLTIMIIFKEISCKEDNILRNNNAKNNNDILETYLNKEIISPKFRQEHKNGSTKVMKLFKLMPDDTPVKFREIRSPRANFQNNRPSGSSSKRCPLGYCNNGNHCVRC